MPIEHYAISRQMSKIARNKNMFWKYNITHVFFSYKLAICDCTSSLKLDNTYVKSYQRRSAAYIALGMYDEAIKDLNKILKLEPSNKQAKIDIEVVNNKIKQVSKNFNVNVFCN